ncbi:MAG: MDR family MFS transporter [Chloroflexota bacterium]
MEQASDETVKPQIQLPLRKRQAVMGAVMMGLFLGALDQSVVGTALPKIVTDLHGNNLYTWVVTSYLLTSTITVPIYGKLSDMYGRKVLLLVGIVLFLAGSALSGLSQSMTELVLFRGLQGFGAGALFPISLSIIGDIFTPRERGRYQGLFGAVFGLSFVIGPFIGGWITDNITWHWVFYVNLPIGLAALAVIAAVLPNFHPPVRSSIRDLDILGILVFAGGVVPLMIGLTDKGQTTSSGALLNWTDPSVGGLILLGLVLLAVFVFIESRAKQPIIPLSLFRGRTFAAVNTAIFLISFGMFAAIIFLPRYYQGVRGISATESGYLVWPLLVGLMGASIGAGILTSRMGRYKKLVTVAMVVFIIGSYFMTHIQAGTSNWLLWAWMLVMGAGIGPSMSVFTVAVQSEAPPAQLGVATSTLTFIRQIGGSVGLAISGTLFSQTFNQKLPGSLLSHGIPVSVAHHLSSGAGAVTGSSLTGVGLGSQLGHVLPAKLHPLIPKLVAAIHDAFAQSIGVVFWLPVAAGIVAFIAVLVMPDVKLRGQARGSAEAANTIPGAEIPDDHILAEEEAAAR